MITSGTTTINPLALKGYTKEQVKELLQGKLADDFEVIYSKIQDQIKASEFTLTAEHKESIALTKELIKPIVELINDKAPTNSTKRKKA